MSQRSCSPEKAKAQKDVIGLYCHRLSGTAGGAQRMVCLLANALAAREFTVHLMSWDNQEASSIFDLSPDVNWHRFGLGAGMRDKLRRVQELSKKLREHKVRVLIGFVMSGDRTVFAAANLATSKLVAAERNAPAMYWMRYRRRERWLAFACLHLAHRITVQSPQFVDEYPATLRDRIAVIPNPVPVASRQARPGSANSDGRFTLLAVGRLDRVQKRLHWLIQAFATIADRHPNWDLLIIGDGDEYTALQQQIARQKLSSRVRLESSTRDIFATYPEVHLFVIPSRWEGFPNALAEAMVHGLPAVGFRDAPGVAELISDGETGWLAEGVDDPITLARALNEAMLHGSERTRRGANGAQAMTEYHAETQFDLWADLIRSLR